MTISQVIIDHAGEFCGIAAGLFFLALAVCNWRMPRQVGQPDGGARSFGGVSSDIHPR